MYICERYKYQNLLWMARNYQIIAEYVCTKSVLRYYRGFELIFLLKINHIQI